MDGAWKITDTQAFNRRLSHKSLFICLSLKADILFLGIIHELGFGKITKMNNFTFYDTDFVCEISN